MTNNKLPNIKTQFLTVLFMSMCFSMAAQAANLKREVANEMAHAIVAHECGKTRSPKMTAGYESGVYMSMNKMKLLKTDVKQILTQQETMAITDALSVTLFEKINSGQTSCEAIYKYVVNGLMPKLNAVSQQ